MMEIPEERAFLFGSAVMAFGLVALVALNLWKTVRGARPDEAAMPASAG